MPHHYISDIWMKLVRESNAWDMRVVVFSILQGKNVVVFYGSQTGTAEEFAGRLVKDAARYGMKGMVADPEECEMVGFICSIFRVHFSLGGGTWREIECFTNSVTLFHWFIVELNPGPFAFVFKPPPTSRLAKRLIWVTMRWLLFCHCRWYCYHCC